MEHGAPQSGFADQQLQPQSGAPHSPSSRIVRLKAFGLIKAWRQRVGNLPMWGYSSGDEIGLCWPILLGAAFGNDRCKQRLAHEMTHQRGQPHHVPTAHYGPTRLGPNLAQTWAPAAGCIMQPSGYDSWDHNLATNDEIRSFIWKGRWTP